MTKTEIGSIAVIGLGYIGLPAAAMFASRRVKVIGVDINQHAVDTVNQGKIHIIEPELDIIVHAVVKEGYLRATTKPEPADVFIIAVPTPFHDDHSPDISFVKSAAESIAPMLSKGNLVILESTSPVGTTEQMAEWLAAARPDLRLPVNGATDIDVHVAYCPERVLPGHVVHELVRNARIIGGLTEECSRRAVEVYRIFVAGELLVTNARTAEMSKLTENAYRDVNIAFANELSLICDRLGINVWELIRFANYHPRVKILQPGCGVGGHCIAVDPWFIVHGAPEEAKMIRTARDVNDHKPVWVLERIESAITKVRERKGASAEIRVAALGLAFKPNIDDLRESPAMHIAEALQERLGDSLLLVEPNIARPPRSLSQRQLVTLETALASADVLVVLVAHTGFSGLAEMLKPEQVVVDAVGILQR